MDKKMKPYPILCIFLPLMFGSCGGGLDPEQLARDIETKWEPIPFKKIDDWLEKKKLRENYLSYF